MRMEKMVEHVVTKMPDLTSRAAVTPSSLNTTTTSAEAHPRPVLIVSTRPSPTKPPKQQQLLTSTASSDKSPVQITLTSPHPQPISVSSPKPRRDSTQNSVEKTAFLSPTVINAANTATEGTLSYVAQDYAKQVLGILNEFRKTKMFCDVFLSVNGVEMPVHKSVLAASSSFFRAMFADKKNENPYASVTIQGIEEKTMDDLVDFAYTGTIAVTKDNVKDLLPASNSLRFLPVRDACCDFLDRHCNPSNCVGIRYFALLQDCPDLVQKAEDYIARNFTEVARSDEFLMLSYSQVKDIIELQKPPFRNEQVITVGIFCWIHHDPLIRTQHFKDLFKLIKLDMLSAPFIVSTLAHSELVKNCDEASEALLLIMSKLKLLSEEISKVTLDHALLDHVPLVQPVPVLPHKITVTETRKRPKLTKVTLSPRTQRFSSSEESTIGSAFKRKSPGEMPTINQISKAYATKMSNNSKCKNYVDNKILTANEISEGKFDLKTKSGKALFVIGGACNVNMTDAINNVEYYDPGSDKWFEAAPLNKCRSLVGVSVLSGTLWAIGGFDGMSPIDSVECYDHRKNRWTTTGRMISARRGAGVTTLRNKIFAIGGFDGTKLLSLCECYHSDTNSWEAIAPLGMCRFALGATSLKDKIYAVGGYDGKNHLATVEMYDSYTNSWSKSLPMSMSRYAVGVTSLADSIYAVGGLDGTRPLATVERFDPREGKWYSVEDMYTQRAGVDVASLENELYAVGGILGSSPLQSVEKYDVRMNSWTYVAAMSIPRVDAGVGAILIN